MYDISYIFHVSLMCSSQFHVISNFFVGHCQFILSSMIVINVVSLGKRDDYKCQGTCILDSETTRGNVLSQEYH